MELVPVKKTQKYSVKENFYQKRKKNFQKLFKTTLFKKTHPMIKLLRQRALLSQILKKTNCLRSNQQSQCHLILLLVTNPRSQHVQVNNISGKTQCTIKMMDGQPNKKSLSS